MPIPMVRLLFGIAGVYDAAIGLAFLCLGAQIFEATKVPPPNHWGYVQFGSLLLIIFGIMFFAVAYDPSVNRQLIPYGMFLKISYTGLVTYYWVMTDVPFLFKPFAVIDGIMFVLFFLAYRKLLAPRVAH
jgi:hypothetical protein